jgi:hypothetical protein
MVITPGNSGGMSYGRMSKILIKKIKDKVFAYFGKYGKN